MVEDRALSSSGAVKVLVATVRGSARHPWSVILAALVLVTTAGIYVANHLGINTDTADMISDRLGWRVQYIDYQEQFPQFTDAVIVVVDGNSREQADHAAMALAERLSGHPERIEGVSLGRNDPFFLRNAFLYLEPDQLDAMASRLIDAQPLLGRLARDPSLATLVDLFETALAGRDAPAPGAGEALDRFADALADTLDSVRAGATTPMPWRPLLAGPTSDPERPRALLMVDPVLDYSQLFPAEPVIDLIRAQAAALGLAREGVSLRITGGVAMADEELRSVSQGAAWGALFALLLVGLVLVVGMGSARLVVAALITLLAGLVCTAAFAAAAVGDLNMISLAFAVLYIGLGVDYAIHFALRYQEQRLAGQSNIGALERAASGVGGALALCAITTGLGFLAFVPTDFAGLSELGLIAGAGMVISFFATVLLLPAVLSVLGPGRLRPHRLDGAMTRLIDAASRGGGLVLIVAVVLAIAGAAVAVQVRFDDNPLNLRAAEGEALSTYRALVREEGDWSLDVLTRDLAEAESLAARLEGLPEVAAALTLRALLPEQQERKLAVVDDLNLMLGVAPEAAPVPRTVQPDALRRLRAVLATTTAEPGSEPGLRSLAAALDAWDRVDGDEAASLEVLQGAVMSGLAPLLERLSLALDPRPVTADALPERIRRDWIAPDGRYRVRVEAREDLNQRESLIRFVEAVRAEAPAAVGEPIVNLGAGAVAVEAFRQAFATALVAIVVVLWWWTRRLRAVAAVVYPLLLGAVLSAALMVMFDLPFNFANVIALPLLLGIGVDSAIHMRERARARGPVGGASAARAVLTSAATSLASFGNLSWSAHPGTASMGLVLVIGLACVLVCTLVIVPVTVRWLEGAPGREGGR